MIGEISSPRYWFLFICSKLSVIPYMFLTVMAPLSILNFFSTNPLHSKYTIIPPTGLCNHTPIYCSWLIVPPPCTVSATCGAMVAPIRDGYSISFFFLRLLPFSGQWFVPAAAQSVTLDCVAQSSVTETEIYIPSTSKIISSSHPWFDHLLCGHLNEEPGTLGLENIATLQLSFSIHIRLKSFEICYPSVESYTTELKHWVLWK